MLYAFEQLIINTEDFDSEEEYYNQDGGQGTKFIEVKDALNQRQIQELLEAETDPFLREQLEQLYNPLYNGMHDPEQYFQNSEDIINEEDFEESVDESRRQSPLKQSQAKLEKLEELIKKEKSEE